MAKKKKDDSEKNEDYINEGGQENIDDADDNFGLPDVDYTPVDRDETEEQPARKEEQQEETSSEWDKEEEATASGWGETTEEEKSYNEPEYSAEDSTDSEDYDARGSSGYETVEDDYSYRNRSSNDSSGNIIKGIIIIAVLLVAAGAVWYFAIYAPEQERIALQEQEEREQAKADSLQRVQEQERLRREAEEAEAARLAAEAAAAAEQAEPETGTVQTISSRTGRYYVVISSSLDGDLANDFAKKLADDGRSISILEPFGNNKFHRVAIADHDSWMSAQSQADELKGTYGDEVWVVKY